MAALKQTELEAKILAGQRAHVQGTARMIQGEREGRHAFEVESRATDQQRSATIATELAGAQRLLQTATAAIRLDTQKAIGKLHESIQLVERAMDGSRNEMAQVLDAEIRTRQKQEHRAEAAVAAASAELQSGCQYSPNYVRIHQT